ncbi:MAG: phage major capsid protein, partial [Paracoccaceae bacterium]
MTETKARAGEDLSQPSHPGAEVKIAMAGFMNAFNGFQDDVKQSLQQQEEHLKMLDRKTMTYARPALSAHTELDLSHKKALGAYLRTGDDDGLRGLQLEGKAMSTAVSADGGYLLNPQMSEQIQSMLSSTASLRSIANVVQIDATSYDVIVDNTDVGTGWQSELSAVAETATPNINRISIKLNDLSAMPKASQRLLDDAAFDVESWLANKIATRFIRAEASAFINGTGTDQPKGIMLPTKVANAAWTWGNLGYIPTGFATDFNTTNPLDCLVTLVYSLA